jgi:deoxyhypusine monooxygenase
MPELLARQLKPERVSDSTVSALRATLLDTSEPLFKRYRAMFALRNIGTVAAVDALAAGFSDDSALFKYVFLYSFTFKNGIPNSISHRR